MEFKDHVIDGLPEAPPALQPKYPMELIEMNEINLIGDVTWL